MEAHGLNGTMQVLFVLDKTTAKFFEEAVKSADAGLQLSG